MIKRFFQLFKIARKLSTSGAIDTINQIHSLPLPINIFFNIFSLGSSTQVPGQQLKPGEKLCIASKEWAQLLLNLVNF